MVHLYSDFIFTDTEAQDRKRLSFLQEMPTEVPHRLPRIGPANSSSMRENAGKIYVV
jgi:hypothetical protein